MNESYNLIIESQQAVCHKYRAGYLATSLASKLGISDKALEGVLPIHGLRHSPEGDTCGWYIWSGEYSDAADFFQPLHVHHLVVDHAAIASFLGLPAGWRFLIGENGYEDVWFDSELL